jgi:glycerophosphoryl diester phosphodiesterase/predicted amidohydrolase
MKACIIQPPYSRDVSLSDEFFKYKMDMLDACDETIDIIVLPEYSDVPCATSTREETLFYHNKYIGILLDKCIETAKRCNAVVFVNALFETNGNYRNTTYAINRSGEIVGKYFKKHLPPLELNTLQLDSAYTFEYSEPYVLEIDGLKYGFLTCYDFYFYEAFANIARKDVDIIIGCSLQRSDSHDAIETMCRFLAYNTNAYVIRSSVSFNEDSDVCGASMVVSPYGKVLHNMRGKFGMATATFDPKNKYYKPAGFGNPDAPHYQYIEFGRKPWQYRFAGSAIVNDNMAMPYPRVCAHRGFSTIAPENSMIAYGAAIAMGAEEIELDLWPTKDGEIVSCHDRNLDRVSNGTGFITDHTLSELEELDFGIKFGEKFKGIKILRFEDILRKFSGQVVMNVHVKPLSYTDDYPDAIMKKIVALVKKYNCEKYVYFMLETDMQIRQFKNFAPEIAICVGHLNARPWDIVDRAIAFGCEKVQLYKPYFNQEMIDKAHKNGIICNVFWSDDPEETISFLNMGIDTILTNDYNVISQVVKKCIDRKENTL